MFQNSNPKFVFEALFIVIFIFTIYYIRSKNFKERNFGLIITSFAQGLLLSVIFKDYLLVAAPVLALSYYLICTYFFNVIFLYKSNSFAEYNDTELIQSLIKIPGIKKFRFEFKKYPGTNSFNANVMPPIPFISNKFKIYFGEELISKFTIEEKLFVLAHEISHVLNKHFLKKPVLFFVLIALLTFISLMFKFIVLTYAINYFVLLAYINVLFLFISGIIGFNLISWHYEYDADKKGIQLTRDVKNFESGLSKFEEGYHLKDYGLLINLIVYTHPITNNRIKKGKEYYINEKIAGI